MTKGEIEVFNKAYFTPLSGYQMVWSLYKDGQKVQESTAFRGPRNIVGPRESVRYAIPYDFASLDPQSEYFVKYSSCWLRMNLGLRKALYRWKNSFR